MADTPDSDPEKTVQLTPETPKAEPKLAVIRPGPKAVTVKVPTAKPVATAPMAKPTSAASPAVAAQAPGVEIKPAATGAPSDPLKKSDILDEVVAATGVKRSDAKAVMDALFTTMLAHLEADKALQLPPLGKVKLTKQKEVGQGAKALTVKIRTPNPD